MSLGILCGLIFGGMALVLAAYAIVLALALFLDSICSDIDDEEETEPIE